MEAEAKVVWKAEATEAVACEVEQEAMAVMEAGRVDEAVTEVVVVLETVKEETERVGVGPGQGGKAEAEEVIGVEVL